MSRHTFKVIKDRRCEACEQDKPLNGIGLCPSCNEMNLETVPTLDRHEGDIPHTPDQARELSDAEFYGIETGRF